MDGWMNKDHFLNLDMPKKKNVCVCVQSSISEKYIVLQIIIITTN